MWTCPTCKRNFRTTNQYHICTTKDIGELFIDRPDELVLCFDQVLQQIHDWQPNTYGPAKHSIVFTSKRAWLIMKPMKKELDLKFYHEELLTSKVIKKVSRMGKKYGHHIRLKEERDITPEVMRLLRMGFEFSLK